ncbi:hypothetical protein ABT341_00320 [Pseudonocardia alni]|uniref:hypothetical protein n=1 Tax=Pseudonocardia alni TaxID=33907 RepID=UPI00331ECEA6
MRVAGIDLSLTRTGVGLIDFDGHDCTAQTMVVESSGRRSDSLLSRDRRMYSIAVEVLTLCEGATLAAIEGPALSRLGGSSWDRSATWWRVVHGLHVDNVQVVSVNPSTLKKWATGRGNADKSDVSVAMARLWPDVEAASNDGWDGLALATMAAQHLDWPVPERANHAESIDRVDWADGKRDVS